MSKNNKEDLAKIYKACEEVAIEGTKISNNIKIITNQVDTHVFPNSNLIESAQSVPEVTKLIDNICQKIQLAILKNKNFLTKVKSLSDKQNIIQQIEHYSSLLENIEKEIITYNSNHNPRGRFPEKILNTLIECHKEIEAAAQTMNNAIKIINFFGTNSISEIFNTFKLAIPENLKQSKDIIKKITLHCEKKQIEQLEVILIKYGLCNNNELANAVAIQLIKKLFIPTTLNTNIKKSIVADKNEIFRSLDFLKN